MILNLFKITDEKIFNKLGNVAYIRNGVGYGFISTKELYDNCYIKIGIGRTKSNYGDCGGGFEHATTSPLKIVIDKNYNIIKTETDSFYNNKYSEKIEIVAKQIQKKLGKKFIVKQILFKNKSII